MLITAPPAIKNISDGWLDSSLGWAGAPEMEAAVFTEPNQVPASGLFLISSPSLRLTTFNNAASGATNAKNKKMYEEKSPHPFPHTSAFFLLLHRREQFSP